MHARFMKTHKVYPDSKMILNEINAPFSSQFSHIFRENVLSGAGRKVRFYAINEELPCQIFNEASVHSITQDYVVSLFL